MDERLAKKYGHLFKFLKLVLEILILPIIFWCISSTVISFLSKNIEDNNDTFLGFISNFNEIIINFVRVFSESLSWLDLVVLSALILLPAIFIFLPHCICKPNGIRLKMFCALLLSCFILWVIIHLATFYFAAIDKLSTEGFFNGEFSSDSSSRIEALGLISSYYLTWSALSRIVVNFFLSEEVTKRLFRVLAYLDYDKGYMNYYYLGKIHQNIKPYSANLKELISLGCYISSDDYIKRLKKLKKYQKKIRKFSNLKDNLFKGN